MTMSVADYARECAKQGLRGDYSVCRADFTVAQGYNYNSDEQAVWRTLCDRQTELTKRLAHHSYLEGVAALGLLDRIPDFDAISDKLRKKLMKVNAARDSFRPRRSSIISPTAASRSPTG
jgi:phenylalanine-4-hydroxylase